VEISEDDVFEIYFLFALIDDNVDAEYIDISLPRSPLFLII
jgi:hypothetical protein